MAGLAERWSFVRRPRPLARVPATDGEARAASRRRRAGETARSQRPRRVLVVAALYDLPYRVMECAAVGDAEVYILGGEGARGLRRSRYCKEFFLSNCIASGMRNEELALEINCLVRDLEIEIVIPADAPSTRTLIASQELIEAPCFPLPPLDVFDLLNDKWAFTELCRTLGIRCPQSRRFADAAELADAVAEGAIAFPIVAKPLSLSGSQGCLVIDQGDIGRLRAINYRPVIVQEFIPGEDIGASIFARSGEISAFVAHRFDGRAYHTFRGGGVYEDLARLTRHLGLDGVYNFDMRLTSDGGIYYLECNPRFFFKMNMSMAAGIDFVGHGMPGRRDLAAALPDGTKVLMPNAVIRAPWRLFSCTGREWRMLGHFYGDLVPRLLERAGLVP